MKQQGGKMWSEFRQKITCPWWNGCWTQMETCLVYSRVVLHLPGFSFFRLRTLLLRPLQGELSVVSVVGLTLAEVSWRRKLTSLKPHQARTSSEADGRQVSACYLSGTEVALMGNHQRSKHRKHITVKHDIYCLSVVKFFLCYRLRKWIHHSVLLYSCWVFLIRASHLDGNSCLLRCEVLN